MKKCAQLIILSIFLGNVSVVSTASQEELNFGVKNCVSIMKECVADAVSAMRSTFNRVFKLKKAPVTISSAAYSVATEPNVRYGGRMEDRFIVDLKKGLCGVFDGHGGQSVSQYIVDKALDAGDARIIALFDHYFSLLGREDVALKAVFAHIEEELWKNKDKSNVFGYKKNGKLEVYGDAGSTVLLAKLTDGKLVVANVGDSRAVLIRNGKVVGATVDHTPSPHSAEEHRILRSVKKYHLSNPIFHYGVWRIAGLAMSRSLGDVNQVKMHPSIGGCKHIGQEIVSAVPDIFSWDVCKADILILATDGLWDVINSDEAASIASKSTKNDMATIFKNTALERGSKDNITVVIIFL
ncbi:MAG: PP2C family protein-serine/threonine phosphatase [Candidatus Dependentiae bacterium]|nr:PP2C family protein-serine/threonine phosphatase [Candidatus Dependentiae bacterium]